MKRILGAILAVIMLFSLAGCGAKTAPGDVTPAIQPTTPVPSTGTAIPTESPTPSPKLSSSPAPDDSEAVKIYRDFLKNNYEALFEACGSIAGIGFIDLDCDGIREMIIFDSGASASMGVQFFDISDKKVECISANSEAVGKAFGGEHLTANYVNANLLEDFRLMENKADGKQFFLVESGNGNVESFYRELIRFGSEDGVLTLSPLVYRYDEFDDATGAISGSRFKIDGEDSDEAAYLSAISKIYADAADTGLECRGVFMWESPDYTEDFKGFMLMAEKALELGSDNRIP